jgi:hypothetical protein
MRVVMSGLHAVAANTNSAIMCIHHIIKNADGMALNAGTGRRLRSTAASVVLTAQPRPPPDSQPPLQGPVLLPILHRRPDEQAKDENAAQQNEDGDKDQSRDLHVSTLLPASTDA